MRSNKTLSLMLLIVSVSLMGCVIYLIILQDENKSIHEKLNKKNSYIVILENSIYDLQGKIDKYMIDFGTMGEQAKKYEEKLYKIREWIKDLKQTWNETVDFCELSNEGIIPWTFDKLNEVKNDWIY